MNILEIALSVGALVLLFAILAGMIGGVFEELRSPDGQFAPAQACPNRSAESQARSFSSVE